MLAIVGPIVLPLAHVSGTQTWTTVFAVAGASCFANCRILGTPRNAIGYSLAKNMHTGRQIITPADFLKHGIAVSILALSVLWLWACFGHF